MSAVSGGEDFKKGLFYAVTQAASSSNMSEEQRFSAVMEVVEQKVAERYEMWKRLLLTKASTLEALGVVVQILAKHDVELAMQDLGFKQLIAQLAAGVKQ